MAMSRYAAMGRLAGLLVGLGTIGAGAAAPAQYSGDRICGYCHTTQFDDYKTHGHRWVEMATYRDAPMDGKFPLWESGYPGGVGLPDLPAVTLSGKGADGKTITRPLAWSDVVSLLGAFREAGDGYLIIDPLDIPSLSARRVAPGATSVSSAYPSRCFKCHNTGVTEYAAGSPEFTDPSKHQWNVAGLPAKAALPGIQCEQCHGPSSMNMPDPQVCRDCHSSGDAKFRIPYLVAGEFPNHHPEGDEYRRSPHKEHGCAFCHDPHKSVWHDEGGVKYAADDGIGGIGNMCKKCHRVSIRGGMGEIGMECVDCHMPELSGAGERFTHLFRITDQPISKDENYYMEDGKKWWAEDADGDSFLTLDLVCTPCHAGMNLTQMSKAAKAIHREPNLVDLTVNGFDTLRFVTTKERVLIAFSVEAGPEKDKKATWSVLCQGPKGWTYWNGKSWKTGNKPWRKGVAINDIGRQVVLNARLTAKGYYTYWVSIAADDGGRFLDSVPVLVK